MSSLSLCRMSNRMSRRMAYLSFERMDYLPLPVDFKYRVQYNSIVGKPDFFPVGNYPWGTRIPTLGSSPHSWWGLTWGLSIMRSGDSHAGVCLGPRGLPGYRSYWCWGLSIYVVGLTADLELEGPCQGPGAAGPGVWVRPGPGPGRDRSD